MAFNFDDVPPLYSQEDKRHDAIVYAHLFNTNSDWWITEYDPDNKEAFGFVCLNGWEDCAELGYIYIPELEEVNESLKSQGLRGILATIQQDLYWEPKPLRDIALYRRVEGIHNPSPTEVAMQAKDASAHSEIGKGNNEKHMSH